MDTQRFPFTAVRLQAVPTPSNGTTQVYDEVTPGLALRITKAGACQRRFDRRVDPPV